MRRIVSNLRQIKFTIYIQIEEFSEMGIDSNYTYIGILNM